MKTIDAEEIFYIIENVGEDYFFINYVKRNTELTFDGENSSLVPKVDRAAMQTAFEGAKRFYHTAVMYAEDLESYLDKYELT